MLNQITVEMSSQKVIAFCFVWTWLTKRILQLLELFDRHSFLCDFVTTCIKQCTTQDGKRQCTTQVPPGGEEPSILNEN